METIEDINRVEIVIVVTITTNDLLIAVLRDKNTFLRLHTFDLVWSKQQVLVGNRRLISDQLAVSSKSSLMWYRLSVLVSHVCNKPNVYALKVAMVHRCSVASS